jgi:hypothetical protein
MKNNLADYKDATTISTTCPLAIINTLKFKNKNLRHQLIMEKKEIEELKTRIFVNESFLENIKL